MSNPVVSVVMTVYNGERFLAEAVESVLRQTMPDLELIVVDDGSTDRSLAILRSYTARDPRLRIVQREHAGFPPALRAGIAAARCELIARSDADDRMLPNRLERQLFFLGQHPGLDLACSYSYFINAAGKRVGFSARPLDMARGIRERQPSLFVEPTHPTTIFRKSAYHAAGGYPDLPFAEDRDLWGRFATSGLTMACQPEYLEEYRLHGGSMTMHSGRMQHEMCVFVDCNVIRRLQGKPEYSLEEFRAWKRAQPLATRLRDRRDFGALHAFKRASRHYGEGRYCRGALSLAAAVSLDPGGILRRVISKVRNPEAMA